MYYYAIGFIIGLVIVAIIIGVVVAVSVNSKRKVANIWSERMKYLTENTKSFDMFLWQRGFKTDLKITTKAYHHTNSLHDIFAFCVDYNSKRIAVCSLESKEFKPFLISFDEIASFKIINGVSNTTSQSFSSGGGVGGYGLVGGVVSTDTYNTTTLEQVKLRIDLKDPLKPAVIVMMFTYQVDKTSDMHRLLVDAMEQIDSILTKIINSKDVDAISHKQSKAETDKDYDENSYEQPIEKGSTEVVLIRELSSSVGVYSAGTKCTLREEGEEKSVVQLSSGKLIRVPKDSYVKIQ